jgi:hypothetical protein
MTEAKTLKDLENGFQVVGIRELKAEAIKWVKVLTSNKVIEMENHNLTTNEYLSGLGAMVEWIRMFFNLSDEDLK